MKLLHLSDLHLGRRLCEMDLLQDQEYILQQCVTLAKEHKVSAVLVAGDVYDRSVPTVGAVNLLDRFLNQLAQEQIAVYIISGNHDSADRLGFGSKLLQSNGIYLSSVFENGLEHYQLQDEHGVLHLWALPFIRPSMIRSCWPQEDICDYTDAVRTVIKHANIDASARNVMMAHQFVTAGGKSPETCDSESLNLGTLDNVDVSVFDVFDYVALGHIHGPQQVGRETVRYCGSPLPYSVSEVRHKKSAVLVELGAKGQVSWKLLPLEPKRALRRLEGPLEELLEHAQPSDDYIYVILTDETPQFNAAAKLRSVYPNLVKLEFAPRTQNKQTHQLTGEDISQKSLLQLFDDFYQVVHNRSMNEEECSVMQTLCEEVEQQ